MTSSYVRYARLLPALSALAILPTLSAGDVKENWTKHCARCHAADGTGNTKTGKKLNVRDYTAADVQAKMNDEEMLKAIIEGVKDEAGKERMGAYKEKLSEQESKDLVALIRTMKK